MPFLTTIAIAVVAALTSVAGLRGCCDAKEDLVPRSIELVAMKKKTSLAASGAKPPAPAPVELRAAAHVELPAAAHVEPPTAATVVAVVNCIVASCTGSSTDLIAPKMALPPQQSLSTSIRESAASSAPASELSPSAAIYHPLVGCANADAGTPHVDPHQNSWSAYGEDAPLRESEFIVDGFRPAKIIRHRRRLIVRILAHHRKVMATQLPISVAQDHHQVDHYNMLGPWQSSGCERAVVCSCGFNPASLSIAELFEFAPTAPGDCGAQAIHRGEVQSYT